MKISNLKKGQIVKNFKTLVDILEVEKVNNSTRGIKLFLAKLSEVIVFEKIGKAYLIKDFKLRTEEESIEVLNKVKKTRKAKDESKMVQQLILLDLVSQGCTDSYKMSKGAFFVELGLTRKEYNTHKVCKNEYSLRKNIPKEVVKDFYSKVDKSMMSILEKALGDLSNRSILKWNYGVTICEPHPTSNNGTIEKVNVSFHTSTSKFGDEKVEYSLDTNSPAMRHRRATQEELNYIKSCEVLSESDLKEIGVSTKFNKQEIYISENSMVYRKKVLEKINQRMSVAYYYHGIEIDCDMEYARRELGIDDETVYNRSKLEKQVNKLFSNRVKKNSDARHAKYLESSKKEQENSFGDILDSSAEYYRNYQSNYATMIDELLKTP